MDELTDTFRSRLMEKQLEFVVIPANDVPDKLLGFPPSLGQLGRQRLPLLQIGGSQTLGYQIRIFLRKKGATRVRLRYLCTRE